MATDLSAESAPVTFDPKKKKIIFNGTAMVRGSVMGFCSAHDISPIIDCVIPDERLGKDFIKGLKLRQPKKGFTQNQQQHIDDFIVHIAPLVQQMSQHCATYDETIRTLYLPAMNPDKVKHLIEEAEIDPKYVIVNPSGNRQVEDIVFKTASFNGEEKLAADIDRFHRLIDAELKRNASRAQAEYPQNREFGVLVRHDEGSKRDLKHTR
jgi:hypothetical protein